MKIDPNKNYTVLEILKMVGFPEDKMEITEDENILLYVPRPPSIYGGGGL